MNQLDNLLAANDDNPSMTAKRLLAALKEGRKSIKEIRIFIETSMDFVMKLDKKNKQFKSAMDQTHEAWGVFCSGTDENAIWFYEQMLARFKAALSNEANVSEYVRLSSAFVKFKHNFHRIALREHHTTVLGLIEQYVDRASEEARGDRELWGECAVNLTHIYFHHTHFIGDEDLQTDAAVLIPELVKSCCAQCSNITSALLQHHPAFAREAAHLIDYFVTMTPPQDEDEYGDFFYSIALDFIGDGEFSLLKQKKTKAIVPHLESYLSRWTDEQFDFFAKHFVFYALQENGAKLVAKSKDRQQLLHMLISRKRPTPMHARITALLDDALALKSKDNKKRPSPAAKDGVPFNDFNFKLAVIEELMYNLNVLKPAFDLHQFVADYTARDINIEEEGYDIIPEARKYYEELAITQEQLSHVKELSFDGGLHIYSQICPFWDGEDDRFDVHTLEDAAHLPNLSAVYVTGILRADPSVLEKRGIVVD